MCKVGMISQERLKIEVKLLLSANRKSYMPHRLAQQRMTLSDLVWPFHPYRPLSLWWLSFLFIKVTYAVCACPPMRPGTEPQLKFDLRYFRLTHNTSGKYSFVLFCLFSTSRQ